MGPTSASAASAASQPALSGPSAGPQPSPSGLPRGSLSGLSAGSAFISVEGLAHPSHDPDIPQSYHAVYESWLSHKEPVPSIARQPTESPRVRSTAVWGGARSLPAAPSPYHLVYHPVVGLPSMGFPSHGGNAAPPSNYRQTVQNSKGICRTVGSGLLAAPIGLLAPRGACNTPFWALGSGLQNRHMAALIGNSCRT